MHAAARFGDFLWCAACDGTVTETQIDVVVTLLLD